MGYIGKTPTKSPLSSSDLPDNIVTSAKIADATIVNADINDMASSKLSGTIADARFPATLPASSGANLTSIPAGNLTGTVADARFPATLPAVSGANLTGLPAGGENNHTSFARGFSGSGQNTAIPTNTMTVLEFSAETFDSDGDFNTTTDRYIAPANGYYLVTASSFYSGLTHGVVNALQITINGSIKSSTASPINYRYLLFDCKSVYSNCYLARKKL